MSKDIKSTTEIIVKELIKPIRKSGIYELGKDLSIIDYRQTTSHQILLFKSQADYESFRDRNGLTNADFEDADISIDTEDFVKFNIDYILLNEFYKVKEGDYEKGIPFVYKCDVGFPTGNFINAIIEHMDNYDGQPINLWVVQNSMYMSILSETPIDPLSGNIKVWIKF